MRRFIVIPLLVAGLALGACAQTSYPSASSPSSGAPAAGTALPPPDTAPAAGSGSAGASTGDSSDGWVSTYPYGTASEAGGDAAGATASPGGETPTAATADSGGTGTVLSSDERGSVRPQASGWQNPNVTPEQHQADIEGCYRYAWSQVERDMRVEQDMAAARSDGDDGLGFTALTTRMNLYDHRKRRTALINDCMESKGYIRD